MRDWIAGMALPSIVNDICFYRQKTCEEVVNTGQMQWRDMVHFDASTFKDNADIAAYAAYFFADAMLEAREHSLQDD